MIERPILSPGLQRAASCASMFFGWLAGYAYYALYQVHVSGQGYVEDFGFLVFGSLFTAAIGWGVFVAPLLPKLGENGIIVRPIFFPFAAAVFAPMAFTILIGWMFLFDGNWFYHGQAAVIGFVWAVFYLLLVNTPFHRLLVLRPRLWIPLLYVLPMAGFLFFYLGVPRFFPSLAYTYYGGYPKETLLLETLGSLRPGDSARELGERLPGFVPEDFFEGERSTIRGRTGSHTYTVDIDSGRVISVDIQTD